MIDMLEARLLLSNLPPVIDGPQTVITTDANTAIVVGPPAIAAISVSDPDAGTDPIQLKLTVAHGTITLPTLTGLTFSAGDGTGDASMTFTGAITDIDAALAGLSYKPATDYSGSDSIAVDADDLGHNGPGGPQTASQSFSVTVRPVNHPPVAVDDNAFVVVNTPMNINVLANDHDPDAGDTLTPVLDSKVTVNGGVLAVNADGTIKYTPKKDFSGNDSFTYRASDGRATSAAATVSITIPSPNPAPVARPDSADGLEGTPFTIPVLANDTYVPSDKLKVMIPTSTAHGILSVNPNDLSVYYAPSRGYFGPDQFSYYLTDGVSASQTVTVNLNVAYVPQKPVIDSPLGVMTINEGDTLSFTVAAHDDDGPTDTLHYSIAPGSAPGATIDPATGAFSWHGADGPADASFTILVTDTIAPVHTVPKVLTVHVNNVAPNVSGLSDATVAKGVTLVENGSFSDPGADAHSATVDYGDGSGVQGLALGANNTFTLAHAYGAPGHYTATVRVTDKDGAVGANSFGVNVGAGGVTVTSVRPAIKRGAIKRLAVDFSGTVNPTRGTVLLTMAGRDKVLGTKDDVKIRLKAPKKLKSATTVTFTPRKRAAFTGPLARLTISGMLDTKGVAIDGNNDGQPGGDFSVPFSTGGLSALSVTVKKGSANA